MQMSKSILELTCFTTYLDITAVPSYGGKRADRATKQVNKQQNQKIVRVGLGSILVCTEYRYLFFLSYKCF